ncbi:MAG: type II toxin-antitoxin system HicA family toxin [Armatimonadetes bacterium]|nr:type II toxin-antitoxin system HicA family toxin [Armatimonadota bacterium]HOC32001.1 type II toxin-antitoxin system HicA family toxin [Armatimonadota bacterium]
MSERIRSLTAQEVEDILRRHGFALVSQRGSHRKWRSASLRMIVIVPFHAGRVLPRGTLRAIMTAAEIPESEWRS